MSIEHENKFDDVLDEQYYNYIIQRDSYVLTEKDFYPPSDDRIFNSVVEDILDGDNFSEYTKYFFEMYEDDLFDN